MGNLVTAVDSLADHGEVLGASSVWETAPVGGPPQDNYLNAVAVFRTVLGPRPLLEACLAVERAVGRERRERWGPRLLDLDLLLYSDAVIDASGLRVPHPRMTARRFVLAPLVEVWPRAEVPGHGVADDLLGAVLGQEARIVGRFPSSQDPVDLS
jgi:2-amino-4-hydroxy-6-hydroxymethyldihydropteridine diphosphokinase